MSFVDNYQLRKSLVAWLKANSTVTDTLDDVLEIREKDWSGEDYSYPNIRVTCAVSPGECNATSATATIIYYSEKKSSKQAIQSQGIIAKQIHEKDFTKESVKVFSLEVTDLPDAVQNDIGVWEANIELSLKANEV